MNDAHGQINAWPTKEFFIDMLTRDITLAECILDLVDNCIHNVIRSTNIDVTQILTGTARARRFRHVNIDITFDSTHFQIQDTCGGISIDDARNEVFRFGKPAHDRKLKGLGVYGIGMKRALFKIGHQIAIQSRTSKELKGFVVDIDVRKWMKKPDDWTFEFSTFPPTRRSASAARPGTKISIHELRPACRSTFSESVFRDALIEKIGKTYALFLQRGITIRVNNTVTKPELPDFARSKDITFTRKRYKHKDVDVLIMLGVTPRDDRSARGWYVFCNGRMVLEADKSELTGWGDGAQWNPKYNHFFGQVLFASTNVAALPWRTTKEGVEWESPVYQFALGKMRMLARPVRLYLRDSYPGEPTEAAPHREVLEKAKAISPLDVAKRRDTSFQYKLPKTKDTVDLRIQYSRPRSQVKKIAGALKKPKMSGSRVGEYTFDYYLKNMCK